MAVHSNVNENPNHITKQIKNDYIEFGSKQHKFHPYNGN